VAERELALVVRMPNGVALEEGVTSLRVPTDSGQVGLRARSEPAALVVEPGLALAASRRGRLFIATLGGLLQCDGKRAVLLTPLAVFGPDAGAVRADLERALGALRPDLELRAVLQRLETGILQELRGSSAAGGGGSLG